MENKSFQQALFLDRDGIINHELGRYVVSPEEFEFQPEIFSIARAAQSMNYRLIVITNQAGIAKGLYSIDKLDEIHQKMLQGFEKEGVSINAIYFCPHHPTLSRCLCRKPETLLFERAIARFKLDPKKCFMLGDKERDLIPANQLEITTIGIGADATGHLHFNTLSEATNTLCLLFQCETT